MADQSDDDNVDIDGGRETKGGLKWRISPETFVKIWCEESCMREIAIKTRFTIKDATRAAAVLRCRGVRLPSRSMFDVCKLNQIADAALAAKGEVYVQPRRFGIALKRHLESRGLTLPDGTEVTTETPGEVVDEDTSAH